MNQEADVSFILLVILVEAFSKTTQAAANPTQVAANPTQVAANPTNRLAVRNVTWMSLFIPCSGVKFSLLLSVAKRNDYMKKQLHNVSWLVCQTFTGGETTSNGKLQSTMSLLVYSSQ